MKNKIFYAGTILGLTILGLLWIHYDIFAQDTPENETTTTEKEIPFIDRDGDGINDIYQRGWGLGFSKDRNVGRMGDKIKEQLKPELVDTDNDGTPDTPYVDTDNDGVVDTPLHDYLEATREARQAERAEFREKMNELVDTDNDGVADTPLYQLIRNQFRMFDQDGDGKPDVATPEEIRKYMEEMKEWQEQMRERIHQNLPPFIDEDGDGVPDNLPARLRLRGGNQGGKSENNENK